MMHHRQKDKVAVYSTVHTNPQETSELIFQYLRTFFFAFFL